MRGCARGAASRAACDGNRLARRWLPRQRLESGAVSRRPRSRAAARPGLAACTQETRRGCLAAAAGVEAPRFQSGDGRCARSLSSRALRNFGATSHRDPSYPYNRQMAAVSKSPKPVAMAQRVVVECWRCAYSVQDAASSRFASIHRVGTPSKRVQRFFASASASKTATQHQAASQHSCNR